MLGAVGAELGLFPSMKTKSSLTVALVFAGLLGACASADDVDAESDFADTQTQDDAAEPEPESTSEREIAPTRAWGACEEGALRGVQCGQSDVFTEDDEPAADGLENGVQPNPSEGWQVSWQGR
jgi:hypothetical protein